MGVFGGNGCCFGVGCVYLFHGVFNEPVLLHEGVENGLRDLCLFGSGRSPELIKTNVEPFVYLSVDCVKPSRNSIMDVRGKANEGKEEQGGTHLSQICCGVVFSLNAFVSVAVPYSSVPQMYNTLYLRRRQ